MHFIAQVTNQQGTVTNRGFLAFADAVQFARFEAKSGRRTVRVLHASDVCLCKNPDPADIAKYSAPGGLIPCHCPDFAPCCTRKAV